MEDWGQSQEMNYMTDSTLWEHDKSTPFIQVTCLILNSHTEDVLLLSQDACFWECSISSPRSSHFQEMHPPLLFSFLNEDIGLLQGAQ